MSDFIDENLQRVTVLFRQLGASDASAETMARQLLKRAVQLASERQISELEATETLLKKVIEARQGS
jgi:hypothetical protein